MLQENINKLQTVVGIDEEIRKNFNVVKEGEKVITIVDDKSATTTTASSTEVGFWQWLFRPKTNN